MPFKENDIQQSTNIKFDWQGDLIFCINIHVHIHLEKDTK